MYHARRDEPEIVTMICGPCRGFVLLADGHRPGLWACEGPQKVVDSVIHRTLSSSSRCNNQPHSSISCEGRASRRATSFGSLFVAVGLELGAAGGGVDLLQRPVAPGFGQEEVRLGVVEEDEGHGLYLDDLVLV